jgi:hypothetical protein
MANTGTKFNPSVDIKNYFDSKGGQSNFVGSSRVLVLLRARVYSGVTSANQEAGAAGDADANLLGFQKEILVGAGIRSVSFEQQINITAETGLGHFDIIEHVEHNVADNTFALSKVLLRGAQMAKIGIAPFGARVLASPLLDALITDGSFINGRSGVGYNQNQGSLDFLRLQGLHISSNKVSTNVGSSMMEDVVFKVDRAAPYNDAKSSVILKQLKTLFPNVYETWQEEQADWQTAKAKISQYY